MKLLVKLGGTLLDSSETRDRLAREIVEATAGHQTVVVHGGGKQMTRFLSERNVDSQFVNGLRVTTPEILDAVLKVFAGAVNSELVASFRKARAQAVGLTGMDASLTETEPLDRALGHVGRILSCNPSLFKVLTDKGFLPVVACVGGDSNGQFYNVNADSMAVACAEGFRADRLLFLTDVDGVLGPDKAVMPALTASDCQSLISEGIATGGMRAKLDSALTALESGVHEIVIAPGAREGIVHKLVSGQQVGTKITAVRS